MAHPIGKIDEAVFLVAAIEFGHLKSFQKRKHPTMDRLPFINKSLATLLDKQPLETDIFTDTVLLLAGIV